MSDGVDTTAGRRLLPALIVAMLTVAADQASKYWILHATDLRLGHRLPIAPVLDFVLTWNQGVSYGLFRQDGAVGRWLLVAGSIAATAVLSLWLFRTRQGLTRFGLALIVGGAVGNLIDRVTHGAVIDFVYFHLLDFSWYVFNVADCAIVAGVGALLYDSFRPGHSDAAKTG